MITFDRTITVLHKTKANNLDVWSKAVYNNCSWNATRTVTLKQNNSLLEYVLQARIPPVQDFVVNVGDYVALGDISEDVTANNITDIVSKYKPNIFKVTLYSDNTNRPLPHHRVEGI